MDIIQDNSNSIMYNMLLSDPEKRELFEEQGRLKDNLIVSLDFNFISPIERGYNLNADLSITALIQKIFEIDTADYHHILSLVMPTILQQDDIDGILGFFSRDAE